MAAQDCDSTGASEVSPVLPLAERRPVLRRGRLRDSVEIAVAYGLILAVEWTPRPLQRVLLVVAAAGVAFIAFRSFDGRQAMGFRTTNLGRSFWILGAALALAALGIAVALRMQTLLLPAGPIAFAASYSAYTVWSGVQQFLLQSVFLSRFLRLIPNPALAALLAAALFAVAHLPNPVLTPITLLWGFAASLLFVRYRNIYPLMIAHAILGIAVSMSIPGPVDHNMRVGLSYLTYNPHQRGQRS
jgi:hypothetical protein